MELKNVRTRFAPSPTGMLHFGNANTALFNWLTARRYGGTVVLRVEDTDTERSTKEFEDKIIDDLRWLGIDWDEGPDRGGEFGPYRQSERTDIYNEYVARLLESGKAFRCYCTKDELDAHRDVCRKEKRAIVYSGKCRDLTPDDRAKLDAEGKPYTIRFRTPKDERVALDDLIRGRIEFDTNELDDFIIIRSNGVPIFLLCNAIDDALMKITHVVRGEDHISNTPKQVLINRALGLDVPAFLHTPIILGPDKSKLSKRHGAVSVYQFREEGYLPEAVVNYLAFMGWNPKDETEFFSLDEIREKFTIEGMSKSPSIFDHNRLGYLNAHWMQQVDRGRVVEMCIGFAARKGLTGAEPTAGEKELVAEVVGILGDRLKKLDDFEEYADFFFKEVDTYAEKGVRKHFKGEDTIRVLEELTKRLADLDDFSHDPLEKVFYAILDDLEIKGKQIIHPTRLALSGKTVGPGLFEMMEVMGKEKCIARLEQAIAWIRENKT